MHTYLMEMLECPVCHGTLQWDVLDEEGDRIEEGIAKCKECSASYPIEKGIGVFLSPDFPRNDLWEKVDSQLMMFLNEHPDQKRMLMDVPVETLEPADQFYRALMLEEMGKYQEARKLEKLSEVGIYSAEYLKCWKSQMEYVIEMVAEMEGPIVDLASGRAYLVEKMAQRLDRYLVATDFSPQVLRRNQKWFREFDFYDKISLLAFDARQTPFKNGSVGILTTNIGLPNINEPGELLKELRRIVSGRFLAITHFYPETDAVNAGALREKGLNALFRSEALADFISTGWEIDLVNECHGIANPTPMSKVIEGAGIDRFPLSKTILDWCVIDAQ